MGWLKVLTKEVHSHHAVHYWLPLGYVLVLWVPWAGGGHRAAIMFVVPVIEVARNALRAHLTFPCGHVLTSASSEECSCTPAVASLSHHICPVGSWWVFHSACRRRPRSSMPCHRYNVRTSIGPRHHLISLNDSGRLPSYTTHFERSRSGLAQNGHLIGSLVVKPCLLSNGSASIMHGSEHEAQINATMIHLITLNHANSDMPSSTFTQVGSFSNSGHFLGGTSLSGSSDRPYGSLSMMQGNLHSVDLQMYTAM
jgi:hypothetical protein